ncbi:MAG TPA: TOPRIM nucleotidyl transferase/hydrolase domain-containing protein [Candidatus Acidoferrum sp.]|nr:TOPRIM nucleotidyl transferase/hydrolase domain-containing protein [Candidatus Acidoferrum sp.]
MIVEGNSDKLALETLARRYGRDLGADSISVLAIGGAHAIRRILNDANRPPSDIQLAGLYDAGEEGDVRYALEHAGFGRDLTRADLERLGFYACEADLEDELIRALGSARLEQILEANGDLKSFRTFQQQPAQRGRPIARQLRRFMGTHSGRKAKYARLLIDALDLDKVPRPLGELLAHLWRVSGETASASADGRDRDA